MHFIGIADTEFIRGNIPMTKEEVRILTLAKAKIKADDIIIDIGAGTGSLSIEAALLAPNGKVFALEKNLEGIDLIKKNAEKFQANNITVINAYAPEGMADLPQADVIFIGGSGKNLQALIDQSASLLKKNGKIIVNAVTAASISPTLTTEPPLFSIISALAAQSVTKQGNPTDIASVRAFENPSPS